MKVAPFKFVFFLLKETTDTYESETEILASSLESLLRGRLKQCTPTSFVLLPVLPTRASLSFQKTKKEYRNF